MPWIFSFRNFGRSSCLSIDAKRAVLGMGIVLLLAIPSPASAGSPTWAFTETLVTEFLGGLNRINPGYWADKYYGWHGPEEQTRYQMQLSNHFEAVMNKQDVGPTAATALVLLSEAPYTAFYGENLAGQAATLPHQITAGSLTLLAVAPCPRALGMNPGITRTPNGSIQFLANAHQYHATLLGPTGQTIRNYSYWGEAPVTSSVGNAAPTSTGMILAGNSGSSFARPSSLSSGSSWSTGAGVICGGTRGSQSIAGSQAPSLGYSPSQPRSWPMDQLSLAQDAANSRYPMHPSHSLPPGLNIVGDVRSGVNFHELIALQSLVDETGMPLAVLGSRVQGWARWSNNEIGLWSGRPTSDLDLFALDMEDFVNWLDVLDEAGVQRMIDRGVMLDHGVVGMTSQEEALNWNGFVIYPTGWNR